MKFQGQTRQMQSATKQSLTRGPLARFGLIGLGGAAGASLRWMILSIVDHQGAGTVLINAAGSLLIGWLAAPTRGSSIERNAGLWWLAGVGFCGGFTTFSGFAVDVAARLDDGRFSQGLVMVVVTVMAAIVAAAVGYRLGGATGDRASTVGRSL